MKVKQKVRVKAPNDFRSFIDENDVGKLPIKYQFIGGFIRTEEQLKSMRPAKTVYVEKYKSNEVHSYPFYKPISKII